MTITLHNVRSVPRVANLDARQSNRVAAWREKMRTNAVQEPPSSPVERWTLAWERLSGSREFWVGVVVGMATLIGLAVVVTW